MTKRVFTQEQIAAARLRFLLDERLGRPTPDLVRQILKTSRTVVSSHTADAVEHEDSESWQAVDFLELELVSE